MKTQLLIGLGLWFVVSAGFSQTKDSVEYTDVSDVTTTARIIGEIPDGTPPLPEPPKPVYSVAAQDVIEAQTYHDGGRTITFQRIAPPPLVHVPEIQPLTEAVQEVSREEQTEDVLVEDSSEEFVMAGATVFRPKDGPPRSLVQLWPQAGGQPVAFWSSADFGLLSAIGSFVGNDGKTHSLMLMWSAAETESLASLETELGPDSPPIPKFAEGKVSFSITTGKASDEALVWIQSLHDIYNNEYERLKTAYDGREQARLAKEAELKANPPQPKNIVLNYWRTEKPATTGKGEPK